MIPSNFTRRLLAICISVFFTGSISHPAWAEFTRIEAHCRLSETATIAAGTFDHVQIWYTFRARVGTPTDPHPKQVVYSLIALNSATHARAELARLIRSSLDLDLRTGEDELKSVNMTSQDQVYQIELTRDEEVNGQPSTSATGKLTLAKDTTGVAKILQLACDQIGPALFHF